MNLQDLVDKTFNDWTIEKIIGNGKCVCRCSCGVVKEQYYSNVISGKSKSCGHTRKVNVENKKFNHWTVKKDIGHGKVICECECGTVKELYKKAVINGQTKSCGCMAKEYMDITNKKFEEWTVKRYLGNQLWECECSCGNIGKVYKNALVNGESRSCGCKQGEHMQNTLKIRYGETNTRKIDNPRTSEQIDALKNEENLRKCIEDFKHKPTIKELVHRLGVNESTVGVYIHKYKLEDLVDIFPMQSELENELYSFIREHYDGEIIRNSKSIIGDKYEIDIYLPEKKLAFEFNGNYWHGEYQKDRHYHRNKTIACNKVGIRLIHIFEYEWINNKDKIMGYIQDIIDKNNKVIYGRDTLITDIDKEDANKFLSKYHIQGYTQSSIFIGCYYNKQLVGVMTFGKPRFNDKYEYELIRLSFSFGIKVVGGSEKMFKYFIDKYKPISVISYCNISKFTGEVYTRLSFKFKGLSKENYVWVNNNNVLSRYQTQKNALVDKGLGKPEQTEDEIMHSLNYYKVYDCGNAIYVYS